MLPKILFSILPNITLARFRLTCKYYIILPIYFNITYSISPNILHPQNVFFWFYMCRYSSILQAIPILINIPQYYLSNLQIWENSCLGQNKIISLPHDHGHLQSNYHVTDSGPSSGNCEERRPHCSQVVFSSMISLCFSFWSWWFWLFPSLSAYHVCLCALHLLLLGDTTSSGDTTISCSIS